jgi:hypothetical protein
LIGEIRDLQFVESNWDGEGAVSPIVDSIFDAVAFVRALPSDALLPSVVLHVSGRVSLVWQEESRYADLEFYRDHLIGFYAERGDQPSIRGSVQFNGSTVPAELAAAIPTRVSEILVAA